MNQHKPEPMDAPDSPGWWAWEDGDTKGVSEIYEGFGDELIVDEEPGGLTPDYYSGRKWWRATTPWESPPAQPPAPIPDNPDGNDPLGFHNQRWVRIDWNTLVALEQMLAGNTEPGLRVFVEMLVRQANEALNTPQVDAPQPAMPQAD